jgi:hypothetical protein
MGITFRIFDKGYYHIYGRKRCKSQQGPSRPRGGAVARENLIDGLDELIFRNGDLGVGAQFKIIRAVFCCGGKLGAERATFMIALIRALDDGANRPALIGNSNCAS